MFRKHVTIATIAIILSTFLKIQAQQNIADYSLLDDEIISISTEVENQTLLHLTDKEVTTLFSVSPFQANTSVEFEAKKPLVIKGYTLISGDDATCDPRNFRIEGSNDKLTWTRIGGSVFGHSFSGRYVASAISINANTTAYKYFRIVIVSINGGADLKIAEMQLFGYPSPLNSDLTQEKEVEANGEYQGNSSEKVSNLTNNDMNSIFRQNGTDNAWIQYELPTAEKISAYALTSTSDSKDANAPRVWTLQGSNDEVNWDVLDVRTNKSFFGVTNNLQYYSLTTASKKYNWAECADYAQEKMIDLFWKNYGGGRYLTHSYHPNPDSINGGFNYWWMAHTIDVFVDAYNRTGASAYRLKVDNVQNAMRSYGGGSLKNNFYDDMEWMALACLRMHESVNNEQWKNTAIQLWDWIKDGWSDVHGGGIMWEVNSPNSKNACSNAPAIIIAARLYQLTGEETYKEWALKIFDWMNDALVFPENGLIKDSYTQDSYGWTFTYNQGTWIGACLELYKMTNEQKYYDIAMRTADFIVNDRDKFSPHGILYNNEGGENNNLFGTGDGGLFKGIFMRYLSQWILSGKLDKEREQQFISYFIENGKSLWETALSNDTYIFNDRWYERRVPIKKDDVKKRGYDASTHLSAVMLFELLDEFDRNGLLPANNLHPSAVANADKAYKFVRLNIEGNNGGNDLELSRWQLFANTGNSIIPEVIGGLDVDVCGSRQLLTLKNNSDTPLPYTVYNLQGQIVAEGILSDLVELGLNSGIYLVSIKANAHKVSQKVIVK